MAHDCLLALYPYLLFIRLRRRGLKHYPRAAEAIDMVASTLRAKSSTISIWRSRFYECVDQIKDTIWVCWVPVIRA